MSLNSSLAPKSLGTLDPETVFVGGGSNQPSVFEIRLDNESPATRIVGDFNDYQVKVGVYALALSSDCRLLAAGTRPAYDEGNRKIVLPSRVKVWNLEAPRHPNTGLAQIFNNQEFFLSGEENPPGLISLAFLDDGRLILGLDDGSIEVRRLDLASDPPIRYQIHSGPVCALVSIGGSSVVSYGLDGNVCLWEADQGSLIQNNQFCSPSEIGFSTLATLIFVEDENKLLFGCSNGHVHWVDSKTLLGCATNVHEKQSSAVTWLPDQRRIVSGGLMDHKLCILDHHGSLMQDSISVGAGVIGLLPLLGGKVGVVEMKQGVTLWDVDSPGSRLGKAHSIDARSYVGYPINIAYQFQRSLAKQRRSALLDEAKSEISAGHTEKAIALLQQLESLDADGETALLRAELCRQQGLLLDELRIWLSMEEWLAGDPSPELSYLKGELLYLLNEPALARAAFEGAKDFSDVEKQIEKCVRHLLYGVNTERVIRADLSSEGQVLSEIEKYSLLERPFNSSLVLFSYAPHTVPKGISLENLVDELFGQNTDGLNPETNDPTWDINYENVRILEHDGIREVPVLLVQLLGAEEAFEYVRYILEFREVAHERKEIHRAIFVPPSRKDEESVLVYNERVAIAWRTAWEASEGRTWLEATIKKTKIIIGQMVNVLKAQRRNSTTR